MQAELDFAVLAADHGLPVLAPASPQATPTGHGTVSFWPSLAPTGATAGWPWLACTLARIHQLPAGNIPTDALRSNGYRTASPDTANGRPPAFP
jgi:hypothetical protein